MYFKNLLLVREAWQLEKQNLNSISLKAKKCDKNKSSSCERIRESSSLISESECLPVYMLTRWDYVSAIKESVASFKLDLIARQRKLYIVGRISSCSKNRAGMSCPIHTRHYCLIHVELGVGTLVRTLIEDCHIVFILSCKNLGCLWHSSHVRHIGAALI